MRAGASSWARGPWHRGPTPPPRPDSPQTARPSVPPSVAQLTTPGQHKRLGRTGCVRGALGDQRPKMTSTARRARPRIPRGAATLRPSSGRCARGRASTSPQTATTDHARRPIQTKTQQKFVQFLQLQLLARVEPNFRAVHSKESYVFHSKNSRFSPVAKQLCFLRG